MSSPLTFLDPQPIWQHFDGIRQIPRPSKHEERIANHVCDWAKEHSFEVRRDKSGNLVVLVPGTPGREGGPSVVLQSHLDMVCEKNAGVEHDFMTDPIQITVDGDWVSAVGTTLGADNGLGAASAMAVAVDPTVEHGPLELLFTLDEETGLNGASALDPEIVGGRILINLDTEEDDSVYIGCAGAHGLAATFALERASGSSDAQRYRLSVRGLRGGHSGVDIIENRGNAVKVAARLLVAAIEEGVDFGLIAFDGGSKRNAIARECFVDLALEPAAAARLEALMVDLRAELAAEIGGIDPNLALELAASDSTDPDWPPIVDHDRDRLLRAIIALPHGVIAMSREVPELVETSNNLAVVTTEDSRAKVLCSMRSSVQAAVTGTLQTLRSVFLLAGAEVRDEGGYPGWKPDPESPVVQRTVAVYQDLFDEPPLIKAVHAGLECGILTEKIPGLDVVSIGPEIRNAHSPDEKARISSVRKFYLLLTTLLADLAPKAA